MPSKSVNVVEYPVLCCLENRKFNGGRISVANSLISEEDCFLFGPCNLFHPYHLSRGLRPKRTLSPAVTLTAAGCSKILQFARVKTNIHRV